MNIGLISLGCAKNQVDSEEMLSFFARNSFNLVSDLSIADVIVINTCGFLRASVEEAYKVIDEVRELSRPIVVVGCLAERYEEQLKRDRPFVDLVIPIRDYGQFGERFQKLISDRHLEGKLEETKRIYSTPPYQAYLKISDGCNNRCTYCAIPLIRGDFRSIDFETLKKELDDLSASGILELVIISQDTTRYGSDTRGEKVDICSLLKEALKHEEFKFIRLLYLYPDEITDELIELFAKNPRLTPYFDVPIQHSSDKILKSMHRRGTREELVTLFKKLRSRVPHAVLRTTLIVGFPGETNEDFKDLEEFMKEIEFDHLGVFTYSREPGTESYDYPNQIPEDVKVSRYNKLMKLQAGISYRQCKKHLGEELEALATDYDEDNLCYRGVAYMFAPDDIDGSLYIYSSRPLEYGESVHVKVVNASVYDLEAEVIPH